MVSTYLPKGGKGIALTFRFLCQDLDPELVAIPIVEESFVDLYYCTKKSMPPTMLLIVSLILYMILPVLYLICHKMFPPLVCILKGEPKMNLKI